ncbi:substrate-binding domain-containing protein [Mycobacterium deserti]|uniref:substrate-binding domain-containing protein n=1 Tax=Mycobacterium deserti TaxID=2978347 RepID=UPI0036F27972
MRRHKILTEDNAVPGAHNEAAGAAAAREILKSTSLPTAVLASSDRCALGLLDVFTRAGVEIPGERSLMGYDDARLSDNPRIDVTTVHQERPRWRDTRSSWRWRCSRVSTT